MDLPEPDRTATDRQRPRRLVVHGARTRAGGTQAAGRVAQARPPRRRLHHPTDSARHIEPPGSRGHQRDIAHPDAVQRRGDKALLEHVGGRAGS